MGERNLHLVVIHPRQGGGIQSADGWPPGRGWGPGGRHALWPWGVGEHGGSLTGGAPAKRCGGSGWGLVPLIRAAWLGDATGARSGPLAKMAVLHRTSCGLAYGRIRPASPWACRCSCGPTEPPASHGSAHSVTLGDRHSVSLYSLSRLLDLYPLGTAYGSNPGGVCPLCVFWKRSTASRMRSNDLDGRHHSSSPAFRSASFSAG